MRGSDKIIHKEKRVNKKQEIKRIKEAKKNKEFYVSPSIVSPDRIQELFFQALKDVMKENKWKAK